MTNAKILIVEDEAIVARDIRSRLTRLGYTVEGPASRGEDAIALAQSLRPDLVLMDICLQGELDGIGAAEVLRSRFQIPVIFLTAHADEATLARARNTEPYGYLLKPFEERELRTTVEIALYKHQADARLRASERRYATTLASIGDAVIATDATGRIAFMNSVAEGLTGWTLAEAQGQPLSQVFRIVNEQTRQPVESPVERVLREGVVVGLVKDAVLVGRDGKERPIDDCAAPIQDDQKGITGAVLVFRDVTESRRTEVQLRHAQKMDAVGQLAGGIAHDFNNLLTVLLGTTETLLHSVESDHPWAASLHEIQRAGERAAELTRQLLAFSRKEMTQPRNLDLNQVVNGTLKMLRRLLGSNIEIVTALENELGAIRADPGQVEQILVNLAVNARDAMPAGGNLRIETGTVLVTTPTLETPPDIQPDTYRRLRVSDTGSGISPAILPRIFEPFFTTKEVGKGTGLGLATVHSIVKQCNGYIHLRSEVEKGTTFTVYFPAVAEQALQTPSLAPRGFPRGTETVLLVEDETSVRGLMRRLLVGCGYTILEAENGADAIEVAGRYSDRIHLLITDLLMPKMGGRAVVDCLSQERPDMKVLCISGHSEKLALPTGLLDGKMAFLAKPFSLEVLADTVRRLLDPS